MTTNLATLITDARDTIVSRVLSRVRKDSREVASTIDLEEGRRRVRITLEAFVKAVLGDPPTAYADFWREWSYVRCKTGVPLSHMQVVHGAVGDAIVAEIKRGLADDPASRLEALERCLSLFHGGSFALFEGYQSAKDDIINAQRETVLALSAPIIPVHEGIVVVPLVGVIDPERAALMTSQLLSGVASARASFVIIDITGVPWIEESAAPHLLCAIRAAELLGARVVVVGVGPKSARLWVELGVDVGGLRTLPDLRSGIEHALRSRGLSIRPILR
jgi:rsbT co-antagonist protein RsbR